VIIGVWLDCSGSVVISWTCANKLRFGVIAGAVPIKLVRCLMLVVGNVVFDILIILSWLVDGCVLNDLDDTVTGLLTAAWKSSLAMFTVQ